MRIKDLIAFGFVICAPMSAAFGAECGGRDLIAALPQQARAQIDAAVADVPYARGILWRATKGNQRITLVGTYHFDDPRHGAMIDALRPALQDAAALYVEAGPDEEARLKQALTQDPSLMVVSDGPTLRDRLSGGEWDALTAAMQARGLPADTVARLRPWYVSMMLGLSPCMLRDVAQNGAADGLDHRLIAQAQEMGVPVRALEPWDSVFQVFGGMTPAQETDMIRAALPAAGEADDYAATLTAAYFSGDVWRLWEFSRRDAYAQSGQSRAQVDAQMDLMQDRVMDRRNRAWIAPLTDAAARAGQQGKGIVAGFGALHLPGRSGVLNLLAGQGWEVSAVVR